MKQSSLPGFGPDESVVSAKPSRAPAASAARATAVAAKPKVAAEPERAKPEKSPQAFRTISEVAEILDTPAHVLRFWESKFSQIKPMKRGGGRRYYRPEDVNLLRGVRELLYEEGMTIKGVQKVLRERGLKHVARAEGEAQAEERGGEEVSETIARLEALRDRLKA